MTRNRIRIAAASAALIMTAIFAVPGFSATSPGSISIRVPDSFVRDTVPISWSYRTGSVITANSLVDVLASSDGANWASIATRQPIRAGSYSWHTAGWNDAIYAIRLRVAGTSTYSPTGYAYLDSTAPTVEIVRPSRGDILVDDESAATIDAIAAGRTTLKANATDALSGVSSVIWMLDGIPIAAGSTATYDFSASPGRHELSAVATDAAGNTSTATVNVVGLPGSSAASPGDLPDPGPVPSPDPNDIPSPDPSVIPGLPTLPPVPSPDPSTVPSPDPVATPSPSGSPSALPLPTLPPGL